MEDFDYFQHFHGGTTGKEPPKKLILKKIEALMDTCGEDEDALKQDIEKVFKISEDWS